jgi:spermidine/putrescine transport system ATP-binding protein
MSVSDHDLECRGLIKRFGDFTAVADVSLAVPRGRFFSILGPSGCGKTTLMRMVAGFVNPDAGDILIKGRSVLETPPNRRPVNMVFQHLALFPMMNVAENIGYGLRRRGHARESIRKKTDAVLDRVGLPGMGGKRIDQLSGGQKQRVAIARCMVLEPAVLLLDEPLGALDLKLREHMKLELKQLQHQFGTTFVYITHDQSEALVMSDQVAVMNRGRFEQVGAPQDLYYRPATPFVAGFVGDSHRWTGRVVEAAAGRLVVLTAGGMRLFATAGGSPVPAAGDEVDLFVRPEAVSIAPSRHDSAAADADNVLPGTLDSVLFNGANSRALVRIASGDTVGAALPPAAEGLALSQGDAVVLRFAAVHALAFPHMSGGEA